LDRGIHGSIPLVRTWISGRIPTNGLTCKLTVCRLGIRPEIQVRTKGIEPWIPRSKSTYHAGIASLPRITCLNFSILKRKYLLVSWRNLTPIHLGSDAIPAWTYSKLTSQSIGGNSTRDPGANQRYRTMDPSVQIQ
jgi:hypothetical protein